MTEPHDDETRPVSVAELLARNGTIGAPPVGGRRRRKRGGKTDSRSVSDLTGEIPIIDGHTDPDDLGTNGTSSRDVLDDDYAGSYEADELTPGRGNVFNDRPAAVVDNDVRHTDVRHTDVRHTDEPPPPAKGRFEAPPASRYNPPTGALYDAPAEEMWPDPVDEDVEDAMAATAEERVEVRTEVQRAQARRDVRPDVRPPVEEVPAYLTKTRESSFDAYRSDRAVEKRNARDSVLDELEVEEALTPDPYPSPRLDPVAEEERAPDDDEDDRDAEPLSTGKQVLRAGAIVLQSIVAVAFGAGLFIAFDELWKWNNIIALVLSVLVILGLVIAVRIVRKTEDIASTLIAVAVGAMVTIGPLALLQSH